MNKKRFVLFTAGVVLAILTAPMFQTVHAGTGADGRGSAAEKVFRAGAATANITPFLGGGIVGGWKTLPAYHVHDELHVRCLALDDGNTKLAFLIVDNIGLKRELIDEAKRLIGEETGLPGHQVLVAATHTHSSVSASGTGKNRRGWTAGQPFDDYQALIIRRLADVVKIAVNNLEPARIGWGMGSVPQHVFVRRWKLKPGLTVPDPFGGTDLVMMNPGYNNPDLLEPAGKPDTEVSFLSVQSVEGRPIALLANYSLHYVGGVPKGHISADYFGVFADRIQQLLGADRQDPPFVAMMSNGTSGDVNNNNYSGQPVRYEPYERMQLVADDVAREVMRVYETVSYHDWVPLGASMSELTLRVRKPDREMIERANRVLSRPDTVTPIHKREEAYAGRILRLLEWPDSIDIVLQAFRIGELGVASTPFETFAEIGLELKERSPLKPSFTISFANGSYGYLPTPAQHRLGGYETWMGTSRVEIEASEKIINTLLGLYSEMISPTANR
jgi:hypothetical protein